MNLEPYLPEGESLPFDVDPDLWVEQLIERAPDLYAKIVRNIMASADVADLVTEKDINAYVKSEVEGQIVQYVERVENRPIDEWNAKVSTVPLGSDKDDVYLGVELEYCVAHNQNKIARDLQMEITDKGKSRDIICKFDRSVINGPNYSEGFEVVTRPMSLLSMRTLISRILDHSGEKFIADKTCGLHVHVNRKPLTKLQISKMVVFVNAKENAKLIETIAGRTSNHYCTIIEKNYNTALVVEDQKKARYEALNITGPKTVEFRIFAASTDKKVVFARIEFARALVEFCGNAKHSASQMDWKSFVHWLENKPKRYAYENLKAYLRENLCR